MEISKQNAVMWGIISFMWAEYCWELFLSLRQIRVFKTKKKIPQELQGILDKDTFEKARSYGLDKTQFGVFRDFFSIVVNSLVIYFGWMAALWQKSENTALSFNYTSDSEITISCIFMFYFTIISTICGLPMTVYFTFILEAKHGFNKQTVPFFIKDNIKSLIFGLVLTLPITSVIIYIIQRGGDMFIVWLWLFTMIMTFLLLMIYPSLIAPLFDKYSPLPEGALRNAIENLAASLKFPLGQLYVVEGSKRSAHSNAYFYGLFGSKRIVLFDTLLENYTKKEDEAEKNNDETSDKLVETPTKKKGCTDAEVVAVLAHELGHWSHCHIYINMIVMQLNLLLTFVAFGFMFKYSALYTSLGFPPGQEPILIGLLSVTGLVLAPYNAILSFAMTVLSRKFEFQADAFAISLGHSDNLQKALIKLNLDNLGFPIYDSLYSAWHHSHPTLLQRLERLDKKTS